MSRLFHDALTVVLLAYIAWIWIKGVRKLRGLDLSYLAAIRTVELPRAYVPFEPAQALIAARPTLPGMTSYGVLTLDPQQANAAFCEIWLDPSRTMIVQVMWVRSPKGRTEQNVTVSSFLGDPALVHHLGVTSSVASVTSGERPRASVLRAPGLGADELVRIQRRRLAATSEVPLAFPDLRSVQHMLNAAEAACHSWRVASGRLQRGRDGHTRLAPAQCLWWLLRSDRLLKPIYRWQVGLRSRWAVRRLPAAVEAPQPTWSAG